MIDDFVNLQLLHSLEEDDRSVPESPILPLDKLNLLKDCVKERKFLTFCNRLRTNELM